MRIIFSSGDDDDDLSPQCMDYVCRRLLALPPLPPQPGAEETDGDPGHDHQERHHPHHAAEHQGGEAVVILVD